MRYKCIECNRNDVSSKYGICEECANQFIEIDKAYPAVNNEHVKPAAKPASGIRIIDFDDDTKSKSVNPNMSVRIKKHVMRNSTGTTACHVSGKADGDIIYDSESLPEVHNNSSQIKSTVPNRSMKPKISSGTAIESFDSNNTVNREIQENSEAHVSDPGEQGVQKTRTKKTPAHSPETGNNDIVPLPELRNTYEAHTDVHSGRNYVSGYVNNVIIQQDSRVFVVKYFRCLFTGVPFSFSEQIISFNVLFDRNGERIDDSGNRSILVEVYGSSNQNSISQYNNVDVYGYRNHNNVMIANKVVNNDNGVSVTTFKIVTPVMWVLTALLIMLLVFVVNKIGVAGIIICILVIFAITHPRLVFMVFSLIFRMIWGLIRWLFRL